MRSILLVLTAAVTALLVANAPGAPLRPQPALAIHHLAEISEVMIGFDGNQNIQYVEINQRDAFNQQFVQGTILSAFSPTGAFLGVVLTVPANVNPGLDRKWIMGTQAFETAAAIQADFEFTPGVMSATGGMVCWGGLGLTNQANPNHYVDCVAYGTFSGSVVPSPPKTSLPAGDCQRSLTRVVSATTFNEPNPPSGTWADGNNANDFAMANPSPENDAGQVGTLGGSLDTDGDSMADCRDPDDDNDTVADDTDNCPVTPSTNQADGDSDLLGDICEAVPYGTNPSSPDSDNDGCRDGVEVRTGAFTPEMGGDRDPTSQWDFYDVPVPPLSASNPNSPRDKAASLGDVASVLFYFGTTADDATTPNSNGATYGSNHNMNSVPDGVEYDRTSSSNMAKPWRSGPPDGAVSLTDAAVALIQFGHDCN
jgi:hypothetical protein